MPVDDYNRSRPPSFPTRRSSDLLTSQTRRAGFSVVANIAEGSAKRGGREFARYLDIALGSLTEIEVALRLARDRGYVTNERWAELERLRNHAGVLTWRLYRAIRDKGRDA